ncbi:MULTISPECIES: pyrroloquinoline quinone biosynthesis peptide chaperone PqqD [Vibrio]|jgi:pyrroloquinoline quinone biosynthesis protein D|uniref:PqqA binding protein n=1 Tax=Vibrio brasiliensis LMG 20546 TaxID=945543 RepID=E8LYT3_9VIBR|nr:MULTISPECIES: pyrroloquinoline quinone biosynthesis peptide chaperone PqqD [Vibrio]EGA64134.1 pyrroloquinoline quinone biosynthesis protein PqqD [Vibrio brasiliensis LMG 20546]PHJ40077.1 pyrroloquinoline quinone biosynthesis protein PqqD [Vibrio sp. PID17_43]
MVSTDSTPELNPLFRLQYEQAQSCYVLLYPEGMVKLNQSAAEILKQVNGVDSVSLIHQKLTAQFPEAGDILSDIKEFLAIAYDKKWIRYV